VKLVVTVPNWAVVAVAGRRGWSGRRWCGRDGGFGRVALQLQLDLVENGADLIDRVESGALLLLKRGRRDLLMLGERRRCFALLVFHQFAHGVEDLLLRECLHLHGAAVCELTSAVVRGWWKKLLQI
jgi:hypothetical protein